MAESSSQLYAYSRNGSLLNASTDELRNNQSLRLRFLQLDTQHRCVPTDWYVLGYDTFAIYTFLKLVQQSDGGRKGFLRSYYSSLVESFVDYDSDFDYPELKGLMSFLWYKVQISSMTLIELLGLLAIIKTISALFQRSVIEIFNLSRRRRNLLFNLSQGSKLYVFSILMIVPTFLGVQYRVPFMTATLSAYQFSYL
jgi:hypothetical protein